MVFQFNRLDKISDFDQAIEVLEEEYLPALLEAFAESPEGQAYLATQPEDEQYIGEWAGAFVHFGFAYLNVTPPKMKDRDAETVLTQLFPRKISLSDPEDANTIIPELIAFWQFLQRQYRQRSSQKILDLLHKLQPTFPAMMNDSSNFGIAKSFLMAGQTAGFDMTTQEGVEAFQQQYNQQLRETGAPPEGFPALPHPINAAPQNPFANLPLPPGVPPELVALLSQQFGFGAVPGLEDLPTDPNQLMDALANRLIESGEITLEDLEDAEEFAAFDDGAGGTFPQDLQIATIRQAVEAGLELSEDAVALLRQQTITATEPGTIVQDINMLLAAMEDTGLPVSGKLQHLSMKVLGDLNAQLSQPIQIALQRPQQKSYPNLHGLYLLLRVTGLAEVATEGKAVCLKRNPNIFASWQALNSTEQYFTLLEAWLIRGDSELLGDERNPIREGARVLNQWPNLMSKQKKVYQTYSEQNALSYWPGFMNLALMQMFGWVEIETAKPEAGKGWRIKRVKPLPWGDAVATVSLKAYVQNGYVWDSQADYTHPWGELQPYFQPYFPDWKQNLLAPAPSVHQTGTYIFKVSLGKIWRRLAISSEEMLEDLAQLILKSVDFDSDHLYQFSFKDPIGRTVQVDHPMNDWGDRPFSDEVKIGDLPLKPGMTLNYLFDFGDCWEFEILLEELQPNLPKRSKILEKHGRAPEQYPNWMSEKMSVKAYRLVALPGEGVGLEVTAAALQALEHLAQQHAFTVQIQQGWIGQPAFEKFGSHFPSETAELCTQADGILLGAVSQGGLLELRKHFDFFANLRPVRPFACLADQSPLKPELLQGVDILFVRELVSGIYFGKAGRATDAAGGYGFHTMQYHDWEIRRIARVALQQAQMRRKKLTVAHKQNALPHLPWMRLVEAEASDFPDVTVEGMLVDNLAMQLILRSREFDVVVAGNLFGDILSDIGGAIAGSIGLLGSASLNSTSLGLYEPIHGTAPDIAGKGIANPLGAINSVSLMLRQWGEWAAADQLQQAQERLLARGYRTADLWRSEDEVLVDTETCVKRLIEEL